MAKILIVDDDASIRDVYAEVLQDEGYLVDTAINGEDALLKLHIGGYDLIFLDIMMPKIDGLGVLDGLQQRAPLQKNGPIIILTNLGHDPLTKLARNKGVATYLIKANITPREIIEKAKEILEPQITHN